MKLSGKELRDWCIAHQPNAQYLCAHGISDAWGCTECFSVSRAVPPKSITNDVERTLQEGSE